MISRRKFIEALALGGGAMALGRSMSSADAADLLYDPSPFGNLSLLQIGDMHAQLAPTHYRAASSNIGLGLEANQPPFLVAEHLLERYRVVPNSRRAHLLSPGNFAEMASLFGPTGGYAHLATVIKNLRASRPESLLLDCGDSFQGSGPALWSRASDMVAATRLLGVDAMTAAGELSLGDNRLAEIFLDELRGRTAFLGYNIPASHGAAWSAQPYTFYFVAGVPVGLIGQAFLHAESFAERTAFPERPVGVDELKLQETVDTVKAKGARLVVLLSQAGLAADMKIAARIQGVDVILSGRSHDPLPEPIVIGNAAGRTLISSVGGYGKFVGVLDLDVREGVLRDYRYRLIPIFSRVIPPDREMEVLVAKYSAPFAKAIDVKLADNEALLYRRGNFGSTTDQLLLDAMRATRHAEIAFTPGYRWGSTILPGEPITVGRLLEQTAKWDSGMRVETLSGAAIRQRLEDSLDEVFNPDPYQRSGEDVVRVSGLNYRCDLSSAKGRRVREVVVGDKPLRDTGRYRTASWGLPGSVPTENEPIWTAVAEYLKHIGTVRARDVMKPLVEGAHANRGMFDPRTGL